MDIYSILPNELFFNIDKNKTSILKNIDKNNNSNYDKILLILNFLYINSNRIGVIYFELELLIYSCYYAPIFGADKSISTIKSILLKLQELKIIEIIDIASLKKITDIKYHKTYQCNLLYNTKNNYFELYDTEKNKIINNKTKSAENKKILLLCCYLKSHMYTRPKNASVSEIGRSEICHPSYDKIKEDLGFNRSTTKKYIDILSDLNLIKYTSLDYYFKSDPQKKIGSSNNFYTLYKQGWENELENACAYYKQTNKDKKFIKITDEQKIYNHRVENGRLGRRKYLASKPDAKEKDKIEYEKLLTSLSITLSNEDTIKFEIKSLLEDNKYSGMMLSDIYDYIDKNQLGQKYRDIETKLEILDDKDNLLIDMKYYKWLMMNYKSEEHDYYFNAVQKRIRDNSDMF